MRAGVVVSGA